MAKFTLNLNGQSLKIIDEISESSFDYSSRHQIISEIIIKYFGKVPKRILDVGGLGSPLSKILKTEITILDEEADNSKLNEMSGDGAKMPYEDNSFDVVVTSDTLEHIPKKDRDNFINELSRVSKDLVVLCAPFNNKGVSGAEEEVQKHFKKINNKEHRWLKEHKEFGLPEISNTRKSFTKDKSISCIDFGHTSNTLWASLMYINLLSTEIGQIDVQKEVQKLNKFYCNNVMIGDFGGNTYRTFFVASKTKKLDVANISPIDPEKLNELNYLVNKFYQSVVENAEYIPFIRTKVKNLHDEKMDIYSKFQELNTIREKREKRMIHRISKKIKK